MGLTHLQEPQEKMILLSLSLPCEDIARRWLSTRVSSDTPIASALISDFPASGTVRNKYMLFKAPNLWYFLL